MNQIKLSCINVRKSVDWQFCVKYICMTCPTHCHLIFLCNWFDLFCILIISGPHMSKHFKSHFYDFEFCATEMS